MKDNKRKCQLIFNFFLRTRSPDNYKQRYQSLQESYQELKEFTNLEEEFTKEDGGYVSW